MQVDLWQASGKEGLVEDRTSSSVKNLKIQNRRYLGNKYKLLNFIEKTIREECEEISSLADLFAGTGVVAYNFMDKLKVATNDTLYSNYLSHLAFLSNGPYNSEKLKELIEGYNLLKVSDLEDNYVSLTFSNTFFAPGDCKKIGAIREDIAQKHKSGELSEREMAILTTSLLYSLDRVANTCGHYDAYNSTPPSDKLYIYPLDLSKKPAFHNLFFNEDANKLVLSGNLPYFDCVYCDPPYNSRNYCDLYHVLENIARWEKPKVKGKTKKMDRSSLKSQYCGKGAPKAMEDLIKALNCRYIVLSYNNTGHSSDERSNAKISDKEIEDILSERGTVKTYSMKYKAFSAGKSSNAGNEERLFVCKVK